MSFEYLLTKIKEARLESEPFAHLEINDFFNAEHFAQITSAPEIAIYNLPSDEKLFDALFANNYKMIDFPGCITDKDVYINWHKNKNPQQKHNNTSCEGFGVTLRLTATKSPIISELSEFLNSEKFQTTLADKFGVNLRDVHYDAGIQKYLDGYEISPHPDIRRKALTYMVNVNPHAQSEKENHHTHYLKFKDAYKYVQAYWEGNPDKDRCWVPWDWCETKKIQTANNSIVIFAPSDNTVHAVKAKYNHLASQRTQLYGNLWYNEKKKMPMPAWEDFVIHARQKVAKKSPYARLKSAVPAPVKHFLKQKLGKVDTFATRSKKP